MLQSKTKKIISKLNPNSITKKKKVSPELDVEIDYSYKPWGNRVNADKFEYETDEDYLAFYRTYYKDAIEATNNSPISAEVLLSQAYKETKGGRNMPKNNMFGITADYGGPGKNDTWTRNIYETHEYFDTDDYYDTKYGTKEIDGVKYINDDGQYNRKINEIRLVEDEKSENYGKYYYDVDRYFREYPDIQSGFKGYVDLLSGSNYTKAYSTLSKNYENEEMDRNEVQKTFINNIAGNYATGGGYAGQVNENYDKFVTITDQFKKGLIDPIGEVVGNKFAKGGFPSGKVNAEGRELVLRNSHGDMAIIPKKYRQEALDMIKEGCHDCLDNLISTLPKVKDYAKDGTVFGIPPNTFTAPNTSTAPSSTIQSANQNVNTSLIDKTREDIQTYYKGQTFIGPDNRTDYERQRNQEAMNAYQNPGFVGSLLSGARMVTRAVADPIQGIGQVFDAVSLGDTRIGQDLGNFNDEEANYRYRNLNPNIDNMDKFMANVGEGSNVTAWAMTNVLPVEAMIGGGLGKAKSFLNSTDDIVKKTVNIDDIHKWGDEDFINNFDNIIKNYEERELLRKKNIEIYHQGNQYFKELNNPESLKRLEEFGNEYDIDLLEAYKKASERWVYGKNIGEHSNFKVKVTNQNWVGLSTVDNYDYIIKGEYLKNTYGETSEQYLSYMSKMEQKKSINFINDKAPLEYYEQTIWHELSHDINKSIIDNSPKLKEEIKSIFVDDPLSIPKENIIDAKDFAKKQFELMPEKETSNLIPEEIAQAEFNYVTRPTETWAFLSTNFRQDLKATGIIKDYNEILTLEKLDKAISNKNTVFTRFEPYIKDKKKFIKLFNKMTLSIAPMALYLQSKQLEIK